ncbi:hypothetical protein G647_06423 [Cladophialophora carrionii CBS 160.54]|uniref:Uncharacterized protein n=1 Tax=Cladophialophora carrionii CBS 160.54 TaxID=1279043 RepID=V9D627_9EURO|nr:uncharacterized protein G647_06423 [Cladophialophora carrionii CBS 160.54]ETI22349.1 hypothetical protein G647_06423 [Cladophialophora carrionii CBS 160.54]
MYTAPVQESPLLPPDAPFRQRSAISCRGIDLQGGEEESSSFEEIKDADDSGGTKYRHKAFAQKIVSKVPKMLSATRTLILTVRVAPRFAKLKEG